MIFLKNGLIISTLVMWSKKVDIMWKNFRNIFTIVRKGLLRPIRSCFFAYVADTKTNNLVRRTTTYDKKQAREERL